MPSNKYGKIGVIVLLLSAVAATTGLANVRTSPAFAHEEHTEFITNVEYIKGHLQQVLANKQAGNTTLAIAHATHPIDELFALIKGPLENVSAQRAADLEEALEALPNSIQSDTVQTLAQKVEDINGMMDEATVLYAGEEAEEPVTKAGVIMGLLETAGLEYSEAVENGTIIEMIEYQDASAFIDRANATFATLRSEVEASEAEEIAEFFEQLSAGLAANADPEDVQTLLGAIMHELEEVFGLEDEETQYDGLAYIDKIVELLDDAVLAYQAGDVQEAKALAIEAYLENYEFIEADIAQDDRELMEEIEIDLRVDLVQMIDDNAPPSEVEEHVNLIKTNLEIARAVVTPEFPYVIVAIAAAMALVVAIARSIGIGSLRIL